MTTGLQTPMEGTAVRDSHILYMQGRIIFQANTRPPCSPYLLHLLHRLTDLCSVTTGILLQDVSVSLTNRRVLERLLQRGRSDVWVQERSTHNRRRLYLI